MLTTLIVLHVFICILLTVVVLLQFGKGAEAGAMMGGGGAASGQVFTPKGKGNFFTKLTTALAIAFMLNSIALTTIKTKSSRESVFDGEAPAATRLNSDAPAAKKDAAVPAKTEKAPTTETTTETSTK